ncbi:MAG: hypothetical protein FWG94_12245 [Oscillospiraceae bacterium]|nr:hypothetical protein [Oscillospiraceae bacterium]
MPRPSKKLKEEYTFFINPLTHKRQYNKLCRRCVHDCKQSYRAKVLVCRKFSASSGQ